MITANTISQNVNYEKFYAAAFFDKETFERAKTLFDEYRTNGIILNDSFSDIEWCFTNQLKNTTISFLFNELNYHKNTASWIGCTYRRFVESVKTYAMFMLGSFTIGSIRETVNSFRLLVDEPEEYLLKNDLEYAASMADFLTLLPGEDTRRDIVLESLEDRQWKYRTETGKNRQRVLSGLDTYFKFNDSMQTLWDSAEDDEKLFWFPLYLWWTLTAILPLRTTEFLLTSRKCLHSENGEDLITLRRSLLKGGGRKVSYRIDKDYETVQYTIPGKMAEEIRWYLKATDMMKPTTLSTLFVQEPHYRYFSRASNNALGYYTYANLSTCLRCFQETIMDVTAKSKVRLGDTRHLAMISLILSGGSPLICKELAGHADINISSHYYSNISSYIECAAYKAHLKFRAKTAELAERSLLNTQTPKQNTPVQDGFCDSEVYGLGEIYDCLKSIGIDGEIGSCQHCTHFIDGVTGVQFLYENLAARKAQVDQDSLYLLQTVEAVRRGIGMPEDIQSALLRLQYSGSLYGRCLQNEWEVNGYGETEKNDN